MLVSSQIFGLILTSCVINNSGNVECQEFVIDSAPTKTECMEQMKREAKNILELDSLSCEILNDYETNLIDGGN